MSHYSVQKDYYVFPVSGVYYVQFRDPVTRKLKSKRSSGLKNRTLAEKWARDHYEIICSEVGKTDLIFGDYAVKFYTGEDCPHEAERRANGLTFGVKTRLNYRHHLEEEILPDPICKKRLCDITRPDTLEFRDRLIKCIGNPPALPGDPKGLTFVGI